MSEVQARVEFEIVGKNAHDIYEQAWKYASEFFGAAPDQISIDAVPVTLDLKVFRATVQAVAVGHPPTPGIKTSRGY